MSLYPELERNSTIDEFILSFFKRESQTIRDIGSAVDAVLEKEQGRKSVQRIMKWTLLFAIQTIEANYREETGGKYRDIDRFEDWIYGGAGKGLIDPVKLRDLASNAAAVAGSARYSKPTHKSFNNANDDDDDEDDDGNGNENIVSHGNRRDNQKAPLRIVKLGHDQVKGTAGKRSNVKITTVAPNQSKTSISQLGSRKKTTHVTPTFGAYPGWWGHEEPVRQGISATALKESKLNALKEKDRAQYRAQLRRLEKKKVGGSSKSIMITSSSNLERAIDSIKEIRHQPIYDLGNSVGEDDSNDFKASNYGAFIDRDDSTDVVSIARAFLKKKSFLNCLD